MNWFYCLKKWIFGKNDDDVARASAADHLFASDQDLWNEPTQNTHPADEVFGEEFQDSMPQGPVVDQILSNRRRAKEFLSSVEGRKSQMKLIVGLGNPGAKYVGTRHNMGYEVLAELAKRHGNGRVKSKFQGEIMEGIIGGEKVIFLSPVTYMNLSGQCVRPCVDFFKVERQDVLIICDDINLPVGKLRMRMQGSAGGQKGLADCIRALGSDAVTRLRIGVGEKPASWDLADYVLAKFNKGDRELIDVAVQRAADAVESWVKEGAERCMTRYNMG